jgi:hypothetical protein
MNKPGFFAGNYRFTITEDVPAAASSAAVLHRPHCDLSMLMWHGDLVGAACDTALTCVVPGTVSRLKLLVMCTLPVPACVLLQGHQPAGVGCGPCRGENEEL